MARTNAERGCARPREDSEHCGARPSNASELCDQCRNIGATSLVALDLHPNVAGIGMLHCVLQFRRWFSWLVVVQCAFKPPCSSLSLSAVLASDYTRPTSGVSPFFFFSQPTNASNRKTSGAHIHEGKTAAQAQEVKKLTP